jgi:serine phosphatase RsbU (regulator of sigma subunit)
MEEAIKARVILILAILTAIFIFTTIGANSTAAKYKSKLDNEIAARMGSEEKLAGFSKEKTAWQADLQNIQLQLEGEKAANEATKKALAQEQLINQSLRDELEKITKLKEKLEENLKEALVSKPGTKKPTNP